MSTARRSALRRLPLIQEPFAVLKGLGQLAQLPALLKQAQEMGGKLEQLQFELKAKRVTGAAGGGLVEVDCNGLGDALAVRIDAALVERGDRELLEDLL